MVHDPTLDHRARMEKEQLEAAERRERALLDQRSPQNTAAQRVRIWEQLHQVRMPSNPQHAILLVIAQQTGLELAEVRTVQKERAAA
jgi:hypothetical protein